MTSPSEREEEFKDYRDAMKRLPCSSDFLPELRIDKKLPSRPPSFQHAFERLLEEVGVDSSEVTIEQWLSLLIDPDPDVRSSVARDFYPASSEYRASEEPLIAVRDWFVAVVVRALCLLIESNENRDVTAAAITSLQRFRLDAELSTLPALIQFIEGDYPELQKAAIGALPSFGPDLASEAIPALIGTLNNRLVEIRLATCRILAWLGGQVPEAMRTIDALVTRFEGDEDSEVRSEATRALLRIDAKGKCIAKAISEENHRLGFLKMLRSFPEDEAARRLRHELWEAWMLGERTRSGAAGEGVISDPQESGDIEKVAGPGNSRPSGKTAKSVENSKSIVVDRYRDIGIGIHKGNFYLFKSCPMAGEEVVLRNGEPLDLRGKGRWPIILDIFAQSADGRTARKSELIDVLGYKKAVGIPQDRESAAKEAGLRKKVEQAKTNLRKTMADLGRRFRELVTERQRSNVTIFDGNKGSDVYVLPFPVRYILPNENRSLRFGGPT
jgi:hypothetical protein